MFLSKPDIDPWPQERTKLEKAARMEDISFTEGLPAHREIEFSQGIPVTVRQRGQAEETREKLDTR